MNRVLTVEEAAKLLQVSARTVRDLLQQGKLPGRKVGREWRIPEPLLMNWLAGNGGYELATPPPLSPEERAARVEAVVGVLAHAPGSLDEFLRQKQEEIDLEEARWERRRREGGQ